MLPATELRSELGSGARVHMLAVGYCPSTQAGHIGPAGLKETVKGVICA